MIVVSDTSPLRYLAALGQLELLPRLFQEILCPQTVITECLHPAAPEPLREWAREPPAWLRSITTDPLDPRTLDLDPGEAAAITLALDLKANLLLIDERKGRAKVAALGLNRIGTLAVLAQAGRRGHLDYPVTVARLMGETNFRASAAVIQTTWEHSLIHHEEGGFRSSP